MTSLILVPSELELGHLLDRDGAERIAAAIPTYRSGSTLWAVGGIGPAAAAMSAALLIAEHQPRRVILAGIAGAYPEADLAIGTIVQAGSERFADLGYHDGEGYVDLDAMGLPMLPLNTRSLGSRYQLKPLDPGFPAYDILTVTTITSDAVRARALYRQYRAVAENMEGAAVALACAYHAVPCHQVRAISNLVGPRDPSSWRIAASLQALAAWLTPRL